jgi:hypothetical protein
MTNRKQSAATKNSKVRVEKLNQAAFKQVDENASQIAKTLCDSAVKGHVLSTRLLVEVAEGNVGAEEALTMRPLLSLASRLGAEPEWPFGANDGLLEMDDEEPSTVDA